MGIAEVQTAFQGRQLVAVGLSGTDRRELRRIANPNPPSRHITDCSGRLLIPSRNVPTSSNVGVLATVSDNNIRWIHVYNDDGSLIKLNTNVKALQKYYQDNPDSNTSRNSLTFYYKSAVTHAVFFNHDYRADDVSDLHLRSITDKLAALDIQNYFRSAWNTDLPIVSYQSGQLEEWCDNNQRNQLLVDSRSLSEQSQSGVTRTL